MKTTKKTPEIIVPEDSKPYNGRPICISGPPGVGKSVIGRRVAEKMGIPFYDIDDLIVQKVGVKTTKEVTENYGRPYFWEVEHICLKEIFKRKSGRYIFALNGGVNCRSDNPDLTEKNKALIRKYTFNICLIPSPKLDESVSILWPRQEDGKRKTIYESPKGLKSYLKERTSRYISEADRIIFTYHATIEKVITTVLELLNQ
ncbi:MAG: AAA family ATPase [Candidatus Aenigmarchaeota archaeon]|nr:AAA family ATPase [Candidatus Aenigmarchaeota archaeon]